MTSLVLHLARSDFVVLTIGAFFPTAHFGVVPRCGNTRMRYENDRTGVTTSFGLRFWALALSVGLFRLMAEYDVDLVLGLLASAQSNEINLCVADEPGWFLLSFKDSVVYELRTFEDPKRFCCYASCGSCALLRQVV